MGVTGTLKCIHGDIKRILLDYNIRNFTFMPSIFKRSDVIFKPKSPEYFAIEPDQVSWMLKIKELSLRKI